MRLNMLVLIALILCSCATQKHDRPLFIDPVLEAWIPPDSVFIVGANIEAIKDTEVYHKLLSQMDLPQLNQFTQQTGVDPRKDLRQVISVSNGKSGLLLARGNFDHTKEPTQLRGGDATRFDYKGQHLLGNDRGAVLLVSSSIAVAGPTPELKKIIDDRDRTNLGLPPELRDQLKAIPANDQIWAALVGGLQGLNMGVPEGSNLGSLLRMFHGIQTVRLGIDLRNGLDAQADATCQTERDAKHVHDAIKGIIGIGRLSTPDNQPELLQLYDGIQVTQTRNKMNVTAHVSSGLVDRFVDLWLKKR